MFNAPNNITKPLQLCVWNANCLTTKIGELQAFLIENDIDICLVSETFATPTVRLNFPNFNVYRADRLNRRGGGAAIIIRRSLPSSLYSTSNDLGAEAVTALLEINGEVTHITAVYNPPDNPITPQLIELLFPKTTKTIVGGDLNSKNTIWGCRTTNKNGEAISSILGKRNFTVVAPLQPTFYSHISKHLPDILDIILHNTTLNISADTLNDLSSDHIPVLATVDVSCSTGPGFKLKTNWKSYSDSLRGLNLPSPPLNNCTDIENCIEQLNKTLTDARNKSSTEYEIKINYLTLPTPIRELIKYRNYIRKRYQINRCPLLKQQTNSLNRKIKKKIQKLKTERWEEKIESLTTEDNSLWQMSKTLRRDKTSSRPIHGELGLVYLEKDKAEAHADHLEKAFTENSDPSDEDFEEVVRKELKSFFRNNPPSTGIPPTTTIEINSIIKKLNIKKAPGQDNITNQMIKTLPPNIIDHLTTIINNCLKINYFPSIWKEALVVNFPKPGKDPVMTASYRPISLLPNLAKIYERIILIRLQNYSDLIPSEQYGFLPNKSTTMQLVRIIEYIGQGFHNHEASAMLMLDVAKAFDRVYHKGLLLKLARLDLHPDYVYLIKSYLSKRYFQVKVGNAISTVRPIQAGVPQGSILGPMLYLFFTSDFPRFTDDRLCQIAFYADDTAIITKSRDPNLAVSKLQDKMEDIEDWCTKWKVSINATKSKILVIRKFKRKVPITNEVFLFEEKIPLVNKANYLGLVINNKLTWEDHVSHVRGKAAGAISKLRPLMGRHSNLGLKFKKLLYESTVRPILTYASPAWTTATPTELAPLQKTQNRALREIVNAQRYIRNNLIHQDLNIPLITEWLAHLNIKFYEQALKNENFNENLAYEILKEDSRSRPFAAFYLSDAILSTKYNLKR